MMKKLTATHLLLPSLLLAICTGAASAQALSPSNLVERPLVLKDGEVAIGGAAFYGEQTDGDDKWRLLPVLGYGLTDTVTIGFGGVRYQFMERQQDKTGLEMTLGLGLSDVREVAQADDSYGVGLDLSGKYVLSTDTALTFGAAYIHWQEDERDNRAEVALSLGFEQRVYGQLSMFGQYTYSDLHDFVEDNSHAGTLGLNYTLSKQSDIGVFATYSDFDAQANGYQAKDVFEKAAGVYYTYRF
ncbi:hypothetical protein DXX93_03885 [Thalassotalea euphylliae]|uniref:MipA/OmpV family protein n=1 Tax=Thalassotalea euphylliae TaxID=1655234 RepID=A0A3E0TMI5_9GAMM|nr:outer membrane beta-barrel protein [Thalassotalea euphylliae]REL25781.1 hypothetical protein DXX93_03885 [Thalassotalea euphylliae]